MTGNGMTTEDRLQQLERRNRWLLAAVAVGFAGLAILGACLAWTLNNSKLTAKADRAYIDKMLASYSKLQEAHIDSLLTSQAQAAHALPDEIHAKQFILEDANGGTLAILYASQGGASLKLSDANGKPRAAMYVNENGPWLILQDAKGITRTEFTVGEDGPKMHLADQNGTIRAAVDVHASGPQLRLADATGKTRAMLDLDANGPALTMFDQNGNGRAVLGAQSTDKAGRTTPHPESSLFLFDSVGTMLWRAPSMTIDEFQAKYPPPRQPAPLPAPVAQPSPSRTGASSLVYRNVGDTTWIAEVIDNGEIIKLQDGSLWEVAPMDRIDSVLWLVTDDITVIDGDDFSYPYKLINTGDSETVEARLLSQ